MLTLHSQLAHKNVGIVGIARSGIAAATKLKALGSKVYLSDSKPVSQFSNPEQLEALGEIEYGGHSDKLLEMDLLIVSPGIPLTTPILVKASQQKIAMWSEIELGYRLTHKDTKIIAVTGSNGKSTTASLIYHILKASGKDVILAGNIGDAYCSFDIETRHDFIVLEVSSFQLDLIQTFRPNVAVVLNITPDHLDRYASPTHYALSKFNIFKNQTGEDYQIVKYDDQISGNLYYNSAVKKSLPKKIQSIAYQGQCNLRDFGSGNYDIPKNVLDFTDLNEYVLMPTAVCLRGCIYLFNPKNNKYMPVVNDVTAFPLKGPHNIQNIMASLLAVNPYIPLKNIAEKIATFKPLEHRLEPVAVYKGVEIINDSKATNSDSVKFALQAFEKPIHLILGGYDKGEDMSGLDEYMVGKVKRLYLIGKTAKKLAQIFSVGEGPDRPASEIFTDFKVAIKSAIHNAKPGEVVLLSPAHASFDWFTNFEERGCEFKRIVNEIIC